MVIHLILFNNTENYFRVCLVYLKIYIDLPYSQEFVKRSLNRCLGTVNNIKLFYIISQGTY